MRQSGRDAVIAAWISAINEFLAQNHLQWPQVQGVGLAIPGPYERYGVLGKTANLPACLAGWNVHADFSAALAKAAGRPLPLTVSNDGHSGGVAEARIARGEQPLSVLMLMPGSGLGSAFVGQDGLPLIGQTLTAMETAHMAAPLHLFGLAGKTDSMRLRQGLGLRGTLHNHRRPAASAGGKIEISFPTTNSPSPPRR